MMSINRPSISIVVPVYNGAATLPELVARIRTVLSPIVSDFEVILVNDGSKDESWVVIEELAKSDSAIRGLNLMRNYGQHNALFAGIMHSKYSFIVTIDDDLQHPPEEIPSLLKALEQGNDVAYGKPKTREHSFWRNVSSKILKSVLHVVLGAQMGEYSSAFRAFRSELKPGFVDADAKLSIDVLLSWSANSVVCVPVAHNPRKFGHSGYTLRKLLVLTISMVTGYSILPLRIASGLGLLTAAFGILLFIYLVIKRLLQQDTVPGFAFLASEIALFAGLQLFAIGVIGEYLGRVHFRTMGKPPYVIRERTKHDDLPK